eukprot:CAMPEP_0173223222 /NCGR_PEP_ID=MMETSP1142-20121109/3671_1 /TAXON_ID=483371 /ORGANISM="non described non described, Strain CCMP2298" /LENGTH=259 /DNA_ID=CAMNT_0014151369 /DNA_START=137 /DNA_END=913 /DNA_ORIENTATION=+
MSVNLGPELVTESIPDAATSSSIALVHIKYSFVVGVGVFLLLSPFYRSRKSFFDAIAARSVVRFARFFILVEILLLFVLYILYFQYGRPVRLHALLAYGNGDSWLYSYGRPTGGLVFISVGLMGEIHPLPRIMCVIGCVGQIIGDALSAAQVRDYYNQMTNLSAPASNYTPDAMLAYYWRDIISLGVSTVVLLLSGFLCVIVGFCDPQLIHPSLISALDLDRYQAMRSMREKRREMEREGVLGPREAFRSGGGRRSMPV